MSEIENAGRAPRISGRLLNPDFFLSNSCGRLRLKGSRCSVCGKVFFPAKRVCTECFEKTAEEFPLAGSGRLASWSISYQPSALGLAVPYCFGYVDLDEGVRLYSLIDGVEDDFRSLYKGMPMTMTLGVLYRDLAGVEVLTYKFRPAAGDTGREGKKL